MGRLLYIETTIRADLDTVWTASQDPARHERWDARFSEIRYLPEVPGTPRRFRYATRVLPGLTIGGTGVFAGERRRPDGTRTSALRFASGHPLTLIRHGAGWWRYVPTPSGVRFLTGYDYTPGWGRLGPLADLAFRPLFGWLTAWSFDRLRLWLERGITPRRALWHALGEAAARAVVTLTAAAVAATGASAEVAVFAAVLTGCLLALVPPLPGTPAARRCLRRPPDRVAATAPTALTLLETP
ncbi:hypothetical protein CS0771_75150 [Catellatospora sp. IY07-71]|uniref:hypothetical protein n=1 Tax=Catellatospora sp. IY07-71 TaxID=2728827 RepID=UPI001BB330BA|nr:hypothetical protein [Catellatospora sp. IY07-71]BCJ77971.1 hypothetical protein CS0771_75150 [Catellatospora sp. IY07-71]